MRGGLDRAHRARIIRLSCRKFLFAMLALDLLAGKDAADPQSASSNGGTRRRSASGSRSWEECPERPVQSPFKPMITCQDCREDLPRYLNLSRNIGRFSSARAWSPVWIGSGSGAPRTTVLIRAGIDRIMASAVPDVWRMACRPPEEGRRRSRPCSRKRGMIMSDPDRGRVPGPDTADGDLPGGAGRQATRAAGLGRGARERGQVRAERRGVRLRGRRGRVRGHDARQPRGVPPLAARPAVPPRRVAVAISASRSWGNGCPSPVLLAPIGVLSILHKEAELAVARAAGPLGVPMILSTASSATMEQVAAGDGRRPALVPALLAPERRPGRQLRRSGPSGPASAPSS